MFSRLRFLIVAVFAVVAAAPSAAQQQPRAAASGPLSYAQIPPRTEPWDPAVVDAIASLPVQHGGRVKPFIAVLRTALFAISHKRSVKTPDDGSSEPPDDESPRPPADETLGPAEWGLDLALQPEFASTYPVITVTLDTVLQEIGLIDTVRRKRDRYSFNELSPGLAKLFERAREYSSIEEADRDAVQNQTVQLFGAMREYSWLRTALDFARMRLRLDGSAGLRAEFGENAELPLSDVIEAMPRLAQILAQGEAADQQAVLGVLYMTFHALADLELDIGSDRTLAWFAPGEGDEIWLSPAELVLYTMSRAVVEAVARPENVLAQLQVYEFLKASDRERRFQQMTPELVERQLETLRAIEAVCTAMTKPDRVAAAAALRDVVARNSGETAASVPLEVAYYRQNLLFWSWLGFLFAFVAVAVGWLVPRVPLVVRSGAGLAIVANTLASVALAHRSVIMGRPPVANLYETFLFIACAAVWLGLGMEWISKRKAALSVATVAGLVGLWAGARFEVQNAEDTMAPLQAVLISNFWLSTHVVCITLGYAVALFSGLLGHVWLLGRLFGVQGHNVTGYSRLSKQIYGTLCFSLFFTVVGTILGGIWAAESWGRFWGWDPKENGAFLIAVAQLFILHGRMGGFFKDWSVAMLVVAANAVVAFSWWYVNVMGVGLHSYGFSSDIVRAVWTFWGFETFVLGLGLVVYVLGRHVVRPGRMG